jgi:hypothetical protein
MTFNDLLRRRLEKSNQPPFNKECLRRILSSIVHHGHGQELMFRMKTIRTGEIPFEFLQGGQQVERAKEAMEMAREEMDNSKAALEATFNDMAKLADRIIALCANQVRDVREARMAMNREVASMLAELRDVRKFFLEENHAQEVSRLQEFVKVCDHLRQLKADGTLDAMSDTIVRMSLGRE